MSRHIVVTESEQDTMDAGARLAPRARTGRGGAAGRRTGRGEDGVRRGLAVGLGAAEEDVSSPTFTLVQEYRGRVPLLHADLYRLSGAEADDLGLEELGGDGVLAVEWAAKLASRPAGAVEVLIEDLGGDRRRITIVRP